MKPLAASFLLLLLSACAYQPESATPTAIRVEPAATVTPPSSPASTVTPNPTAMPNDPLSIIKQDLAQTLNVAVDSIEVVLMEAVIWNDGALGCPQTGVFYTQALVPGYRAVLRVAGTDYFYSASQTGNFINCPHAPEPETYHYADT